MTAQQKTQLNTKGWIEFYSKNDNENLFNLSRTLGQIIKHPNGNDIDYLKLKNKDEAKENTFSYNFEYKKFPFHTDTAFWDLPARFVLMSCEGVSSAGTTFIGYDEIYKKLLPSEIIELKKSIFLIKTPTKNFYTSFINTYNNQIIFDNWRILHGRESVKNDENRILKRIYIK